MQFKNKAMATLFVTILVSSMAISLGILAQPASAEVINGVNYNADTAAAIHAGMTWDLNANASANRLLLWNRFHDQIPTWAFLIASPNPVGVGQAFNMIMMNPQVPQNALLTNDIRYMFTIDVTKPNGATEKLPPAGATRGSVAQGGILNGQFLSDSTGSTYTAYTPDQTGNYTFVLHFQQLQYLWQSANPTKAHYFSGVDNTWYGVTLKASDYTLTVNVQQDPVTLNGLPIIQNVPTEYWTRPIEGQNTGWYQVSSNWLSGPHDRDNGGAENRYQAEGIAPNSAHILWTRPTEDNGLVGGLIGARDDNTAGNAFNAGSQYQPRWTNQIIMYGRLYYSPNVLSSGSSSAMDCVDLRTGELLWERDTGGANVEGLLGVSTTANMAQFGYYYSQDDPNEHGIQNPGWLFSSNYAIGYQPERGIPFLNITGVPSGFELQAPNGENIRYSLLNVGTSASPSYVLSQWNSSKTIPMIGAGSNPSSNQINASTTARFDFYRIPLSFKFATTPTIRAGVIGDYLWGSNGTWNTGTSGPNYAYADEVTIWKISVKPDSTFGNLVYMKNMRIDDPATNQNEMIERATGAERRFVTILVPSCAFKIYDIDTGNLVGTTDAQADFQAYGYFTWPSLISQTQTKMAYGTLFTGGYTGAVSAYSLADGHLMWRDIYPAGGQKIPNYVQMIGMIADGKIFVGTHEHSADTPLYKGERIKALNATDGTEMWSMAGWAYPMTWAVADGIAVFWNNYDAQVYALGKGPSQMTTYVQNDVITFGNSVMIKGAVTDVSAGTKQKEQTARFPTGVPAVNDASQAQWMEYVYMQKGKPTNTTGVDVTISVIDSNGNFREIGTTKTIEGFFSLNWKPDITGTYTVYASFAGTESYWPSHAVTAFNVDAAAPTATAQPTQGPSMADLYAIPAIAGLFVFVAIIGLVIILVLRKRP
jgi:outer membrane protein assembly factor BamB